MLPPLAVFPHLPEDIVAKHECSKTWVAFTEGFLDQDLSNILISRQGGILPRSLRLDFPSKKGNKEKLVTLTEVSPFV
jgi:hypothetical protein